MTDRPVDSDFRCNRCNHMRPAADGKWVDRGIGPGHFVAVCRRVWLCRLRGLS